MTIEIPVNDFNPVREDEIKKRLERIFKDIEAFRSMYDPSTYKRFAFSVFIPGDLSISLWRHSKKAATTRRRDLTEDTPLAVSKIVMIITSFSNVRKGK